MNIIYYIVSTSGVLGGVRGGLPPPILKPSGKSQPPNPSWQKPSGKTQPSLTYFSQKSLNLSLICKKSLRSTATYQYNRHAAVCRRYDVHFPANLDLFTSTCDKNPPLIWNRPVNGGVPVFYRTNQPYLTKILAHHWFAEYSRSQYRPRPVRVRCCPGDGGDWVRA